MPSSTTCSRWPSGSIASTNGWLMSMRRPLDLSIRSTSSCTCARGEHQVGQLVAAVAGDEDPARVVDPDLLDASGRRGTAAAARSPETRATSSPTTASTSGDRGDHAGQAALVVVAHHALGDPAYEPGVALRVHALTADQLAHVLVEELDDVVVLLGLPDHHGDPRLRAWRSAPNVRDGRRRTGGVSGNLWRTPPAPSARASLRSRLAHRSRGSPGWAPGDGPQMGDLRPFTYTTEAPLSF